ncbi:phosphotransferase [Actinoplanes sp. NPDC023714]|uniref:phosphotransferase family protein n=1 Tax=Actinoplanes sp. NPDC023714 TaxID=3154322 RepID=UPI0033E6C140
MNRTVSLVLTDPQGILLGALPPFDVVTPWWQEVAEVVAKAGPDVTVLRLLHADRSRPPGGHVTYLASCDPSVERTLVPIPFDDAPHPLRAPYAEAGGPEASLAWAAGALDRIGLTGTTAVQQRTWNLSALWRFDLPDGAPAAWLKQVPPFFAHEPEVLRLVDAVSPGLVPYVLAAGEQGRTLLAHVPGEDRYGAGPSLCAEVVAAFQPVQAQLAGKVTGLPDHRIDVDEIVSVAKPHLSEIPGLSDLLEALPDRLAAVDECGLPDTLIHGDLHPGNVRTRGDDLVIVDWGDSGIGNPAFDIMRLTDDPDVMRDWAARWPGCDGLRAVELLRPVAELRAAAAYAGFVAHIEPSEWPYHAADVPDRLRAAVEAAA